ncbi:MAG: LysR family transcriptional regulator [Nitrosomonadaceae bacterium]|nr:LysR family transcriptional regulator [Nitrosomonadaceae bacterium]
MRHSTLRQLEVFETINRLGSFTRAAEELCVTQPTVSMQIKNLTDAIGLPLFEQIGKKMYLTEAGRELHQACLGIFEHLTQFEMIAADMKGLKAGKLKLAVVTTAEYFAPRLLGMFCQQYPEIEVSLEVSNRKHILDRLANNMDDLYILDLPPKSEEIIVQSFLQNPLVVLASVNHPLAKKKKITLKRIAEEPFIFRENGSGTRIETESFFTKQNLKLKTKMTLGSNEAIKQAMLGGLGVSVLSRHTLTLDSHKDQLAVLDVKGFPINCQWHYAYPLGKNLSVVAQTFLEYLQNPPQLIVDLALTGVGIITFPER